MVHEEELLDVVLKNPLSLVYLSIVALTWCVACGSHIGDTVELELRAYRLQQFDLQVPLPSRDCIYPRFRAPRMDRDPGA
jgi:hypothetical protein